jgi:hypothetical protein
VKPIKEWGKAFNHMAPDITSMIPVRQVGSRVQILPWEALVTDPEQIKSFRAEYLEAYRHGNTVDFETA